MHSITKNEVPFESKAFRLSLGLSPTTGSTFASSGCPVKDILFFASAERNCSLVKTLFESGIHPELKSDTKAIEMK